VTQTSKTNEFSFRKYEFKPFDAQKCNECGSCLTDCPVMKLPIDEAIEEIKSLKKYISVKGYNKKSTEVVLKKCTSCQTCNLICPNDCRPANLILDIWHEKYIKEGLPMRAKYFMPHAKENFRTFVINKFNDEDKQTIEKWKSMKPVEEFFFPGCNIITTPYLTYGRLFSNLDIRGSLDNCCGEMYFRMGLYDSLKQVAKKNTEWLRALKAKRVLMLCTAGLNLFTNILPQFGAEFSGIEFIPYMKVIYDKLKSGEFEIVKKFDGKTVTIQESCHAKLYEPHYYDLPRKILELLGFKVIEAENSKQSMLCCGIGSGFSHESSYTKFGIIGGARKCLKNAIDTKADYVCVYCAGCLEMISVGRYFSPTTKPIYHLIELIQEAIGETPKRKQRKIVFDFLEGTILKQKMGKKRFYVEDI
jgi:Fe-S oxidoreductase